MTAEKQSLAHLRNSDASKGDYNLIDNNELSFQPSSDTVNPETGLQIAVKPIVTRINLNSPDVTCIVIPHNKEEDVYAICNGERSILHTYTDVMEAYRYANDRRLESMNAHTGKAVTPSDITNNDV